MEQNRFSVERLENFINSVLTSHGFLKTHARICSTRMIESDLRGMHGHGVFRLPSYCQRIREGGYNKSPNIKIQRETPVSALVKGDNGLGQVVMTKAVDLAISKAKKSGMAWVGIQQSNHAGAGGVYTSLSLRHDLISMYMAVGNANLLPPWGGVDQLLGTNPISFAMPTGKEPPLVLDMATTVTSYGKVKVNAQKGEPMPIGWMVDRQGRPLTDPSKVKEGFLIPIGGHKGYGLSLVIGCLAGVLNAAAVGSAVIDFNKDFKSPTNTGHIYFAMKPDLFRDLDEYKAEMDLKLREIRESTPMEGTGPIRVPGEMALIREKEMRVQGIPIAPKVLADLQKIGKELDLEDSLE